jgi:hypothetical protein
MSYAKNNTCKSSKRPWSSEIAYSCGVLGREIESHLSRLKKNQVHSLCETTFFIYQLNTKAMHTKY